MTQEAEMARLERIMLNNGRLLILLLTVGSLSVACGPRAGTETPIDGTPESTLVFDVELVVERNGQATTVTAEVLFADATSALKREAWADCARDFDVLWKSMEGSDYYLPSLYNAGLCYERQEAWNEAAARYLFLIDAADNTKDGLDAYFRLAESDANNSRWDRVRAGMTVVLAREDLRHFDSLEARYRLGMAHVAMGEFTEAEREFKTAIRENRRAGAATLPGGNYFVSGCHYGMALVYHSMFSEIKFTLPEAQMQKDMETKKQLARQAYQHYVKTIREKNHFWSILSGYMVGKLFEDFYYDILTAEIPHDLTDEEVSDYFFALRDELKPLLEQALGAYEKTSAVSERIGVENIWAKHTDERMERLRTYLTDEEAFRNEEASIVEWNRRLSEMEGHRKAEPNDPDLPVAPPRPPMPVAKPAAPY